MRLKIFLLTFIAMFGCDATIGKLASLGKSAHIKCYSGTKLIYEGTSSGKVLSEKIVMDTSSKIKLQVPC